MTGWGETERGRATREGRRRGTTAWASPSETNTLSGGEHEMGGRVRVRSASQVGTASSGGGKSQGHMFASLPRRGAAEGASEMGTRLGGRLYARPHLPRSRNDEIELGSHDSHDPPAHTRTNWNSHGEGREKGEGTGPKERVEVRGRSPRLPKDQPRPKASLD